MGETNKQVRVDNWGIFFLQRLQMFFNKTDFCDLTLQFEGNVQLKVHRLVMSACTEYFSVLEHTCEVIDGNTIIMPDDLQTDVILPIVNFMYTGMLDFNMSIYDKLYRTADLMNIPILTKLLDAQRKPVPRTINRNLAQKSVPRKVHNNDLPSQLPGRKVPVWKRKSFPVTPQRTHSPHTLTMPETKRHTPADPLALFDNTPKPTRFEWPDEELDSTFNLIDSSFNDISYSSKPLFTQDDELRASTSFEDLKHSQSTNKKSNNYTNQPIDINDIKDYVKEQKTRAELAECEDDYDCNDPENYLSIKRKPKDDLSPETSKRVRFNEKENRETTISVTPKIPGEMDHTKIISEVLRKYPHLVKKNKNIKLKIMAKPLGKPTELKTIMKPAINTKIKMVASSQKESPKIKVTKSTKIQQDNEGPWLCRKCPTANEEPVEFVLYYLYRKHMTEVHNEKFDPNMCKHCGHQSTKQNMLMYHQYTKHGVIPHSSYKFPKCDRCPFIAMTDTMLQKHMLNHSKFDLQCTECKVAFSTENSLEAHMQITSHTGKSGVTNFDCQYCTKRYNTSSDLFSHIKSLHRDEARRDGMVSIDETDYDGEDQQDDEMDTQEFLPIVPQQPETEQEKINVISNVKVPVHSNSVAEASSTASSGAEIIGNIGLSGAGLVDIVVLDDNQQYILHNDQRLVTRESLIDNQAGYMIPQIENSHSFAQSQNITEVITSQPNVMLQNSEIASTDELVMVLTDHDYNDGNNGILTNDNSNIVVLYSHPVDGQQNQFITSEGKLMLNSQTGMLELRNENTDSQDGQIESIELIQREINSGLLQQGTGIETDGGGQGMLRRDEGSAQDTVGIDYQEEVALEGKNAVDVEEVVDNGKMIVEEANDQGVTQEMMEMEEEHKEIPQINVQHKPNALPDLSEDTTEELQISTNEDMVAIPTSDPIPSKEYHSESGNVQDSPSSIPVEIEQSEEVIERMETIESDVENFKNLTEEENQIEGSSVESSQIPDVNTDNFGQQVVSPQNLENSDSVSEEVAAESVEDLSERVHETSKSILEHADNIEAISSRAEGNEKLEGVGKVLEFPESTNCSNYQIEDIRQQEEITPMLIQEEEEMRENVSVPEIIPELPSEDSTINNDDAPEVELPSCNVALGPLQVENMSKEACTEHIDIETQTLESVGAKVLEIEATTCVNEDIIPENKDTNLESEDTIPESADKNLGNEQGITESEERFVEIDEGIVVNDKRIVENDERIVENDERISENEERITENEERVMENEERVMENEERVMENEERVMDNEERVMENEETMPEDEEMILENEEGLAFLGTPLESNTHIVEEEMEEQSPIIEESTTDDVQMDENSQTQDSQMSSSKDHSSDVEKLQTSQSTKISILDDWEDTEDSQQSDNTIKKAEITVNKLIDDWDDEDDEGTKRSADI